MKVDTVDVSSTEPVEPLGLSLVSKCLLGSVGSAEDYAVNSEPEGASLVGTLNVNSPVISTLHDVDLVTLNPWFLCHQ